MRVLGIDCGAERTGYGVIESDGRQHRMVAAGVIEADPGAPFGERLKQIASELRSVISAHQPDQAAIEQVFCAKNVRTALRLAHVRGVALLAATEAGLEIGEYSALEVKTAVVGYGRADKRQVKIMVRSLLALPDIPTSEDAADALAVAICHASRHAPAQFQEPAR